MTSRRDRDGHPPRPSRSTQQDSINVLGYGQEFSRLFQGIPVEEWTKAPDFHENFATILDTWENEVRQRRSNQMQGAMAHSGDANRESFWSVRSPP